MKIPAFLRRLLRRADAPASTPSQAANRARQASGLWGERIAADFLRRKGFRIAATRVAAGRGEIDIIASHDAGLGGGARQIVFVEVKTRASELFGGGLAAVDRRKRQALRRAALRWLRGKPRTAFRFDIIEVVGSPSAPEPPIIRHYENAFTLETRHLV